MSEISINALMVLIQLLDQKVWTIKNQVEQADEDDECLADLEEELLVYSKVEQELRSLYEEACASVGNYPPYSELIQ